MDLQDCLWFVWFTYGQGTLGVEMWAKPMPMCRWPRKNVSLICIDLIIYLEILTEESDESDVSWFLDWDVLFLNVSGFFVALLSFVCLLKFKNMTLGVETTWHLETSSIPRAGASIPWQAAEICQHRRALLALQGQEHYLEVTRQRDEISMNISNVKLRYQFLESCFVGTVSCPERRHSILLHITEETTLQWGVDHGRPQEIAGSTAGALCFLCLDGCISETPGRLSHSEPFFHICRAVTSLPLQGCHRESWAKISKSFLGNSFQKAARDTNEFHGVLTRISKDMLQWYVYGIYNTPCSMSHWIFILPTRKFCFTPKLQR